MTESPLLQALAPLRHGRSDLRPLSSAELQQLEIQGNRLQRHCIVLAGPGFDVSQIHDNRLAGRVVLDGEIDRSVLEDTEVAPGARIDQCPLVRRTLIGAGALLRNSTLDCSSATSYGVGTIFRAGLETPGREVRIWDSMTLESAERYLTDPQLRLEVEALADQTVFNRTVIAAGAVVINCAWIDRAYLGPLTRATAVQWVENAAVFSSEDEPVILGAGVQIRDSVVQWGARVDSSAQVSRSILLEYSGAERQALVSESLIGPNTIVGGGEVTACFLGPFVGFHHQSLLIATWWPEGRGNVGYGANIGSNHTSRAPDQELWAGEGTYFGLATSVKFPSNFHDSPYSILASGVVTLPQKLSLPFSLILDEPLDREETRGLNRVIPGWVLRENVYLLLRNEAKFLQRNRARRHRFDLRIFRPEIVEKLWKARVLLANTEGKPVYTKVDFPAVGKNYLLEEDRKGALDTYRSFLKYGALKLFAEHILEQYPCDLDWLTGLFRRLNLDYFSTEQNLALYWEEEQELWRSSVRAKERDEVRGTAIIPDYAVFHRPAEEDDFLQKKRVSLDVLKEKIRKITPSIS